MELDYVMKMEISRSFLMYITTTFDLSACLSVTNQRCDRIYDDSIECLSQVFSDHHQDQEMWEFIILSNLREFTCIYLHSAELD